MECLTLEDDKLRAFSNLPVGVRGFWLMTGAYMAERLEMAQKDGSLGTVMAVCSLSDVSGHLQSLR